MTAIRVIFDGKTFVPQEPVALPAQSEAMVLVRADGGAAREEHDAQVRAYYQSGSDADDDAWGKVVSPQSHKAWDED